jgi:hypothetical protein
MSVDLIESIAEMDAAGTPSAVSSVNVSQDIV